MITAGGFVRLYRCTWDHPAFRNKQEASVFCWMLSAAQWRPGRIATKHGPVSLERGELIIAERKLEDDFGLHRNTVRSLLQRMVNEGIIERFPDRAPHRAGTVVRILKYTEDQGAMSPSDRSEDQKRTATDTGAGPIEDLFGTKNNEGNEQKKGNEGNWPPPRPLAAAGAEPMSIRDALWRDGLPILRKLTGKPERASRAFLGKLLKATQDDCAKVYAALRQAESLRPVDPSAYLIRSCAATASAPHAVKPRSPTAQWCDQYRQDAEARYDIEGIAEEVHA